MEIPVRCPKCKTELEAHGSNWADPHCGYMVAGIEVVPCATCMGEKDKRIEELGREVERLEDRVAELTE